MTAATETALHRLSEAARGYAFAKASHKVDEWTSRLMEVAKPDGATGRAGVEGVKASMRGGNPVAGALKGAWLGASGRLKVAMVVSLVLLLVLSPVLLLVLLLGLLVAALVAGVRAATR